MDEIDYYDTLPKKRIGALMLFLDEQERILLVKPTYRLDWLLPGGTVEGDESPLQAALREVQEEVHLTVMRTRLLCIDYVAKTSERGESLQFVFYGGVLSSNQIASIVLPEDELAEYRLVPLHVACTLTSLKLARRLSASLQALHQDTTVFLEDGETPDICQF